MPNTLITPIIDKILKTSYDSIWIKDNLASRRLISYIQKEIGQNCFDEIISNLQRIDTPKDFIELRERVIRLNEILENIEDAFPVLLVGDTIKKAFNRTVRQAKNLLSQAEQKINTSEEHVLDYPKKSDNVKLLEEMIAEIKSKADAILGELVDLEGNNEFEFGKIWLGNFSWLRNLCEYQNRFSDSDEFRRQKLVMGVKRIGKYQVIEEYLRWLTMINAKQPHMQGAIQRWESDREWLLARYS